MVFLLFFSAVHVLPTGTQHPVDFLVPGILALAVMSTAMTALGIATGFERGYGVLKRLGSTPLGRPRCWRPRSSPSRLVEVVQAAVLVAVGYALGWTRAAPAGRGPWSGRPSWPWCSARWPSAGSACAGRHAQAVVNLAVANGLFVVLLLLGGMLIPLAKLPGWLADVAKVLPAAALADALHGPRAGTAVTARDWVVLAVWAVAAPVVAGLTFRWE